MMAAPTTAADESQYICTLPALHPLRQPTASGLNYIIKSNDFPKDCTKIRFLYISPKIPQKEKTATSTVKSLPQGLPSTHFNQISFNINNFILNKKPNKSHIYLLVVPF